MIQEPLTFARADYLWLLSALPLLVLLRYASHASSGKALNAFTAPRLRDALVSGANPVFGWLVFGLQLSALGLFVLAIAQPQWGEEEIERVEGGRDIIIAIDTSRSMLANDITPDRLTRATLAAQDLLQVLPGDRVGLIAFSGHAYLQAPLTTDHDAVAESIQSLDFLSVPKGGSVISDAINLAIKTFEKSPARTHGLILISDGGDVEARIPAMIEKALENQILILTVGVGTEGGSLIPNPDPNARGDYIRDNQGNVVQTKLDSGVLRELATGTRGAYFQLGTRSLAAAGIAEVLNQLDMQLLAETETTRPIERFQWPLGAGMLLLMIAWMLRPSRPRLGLGRATASGLAKASHAVGPAAALVFLALTSSASAGTLFGINIPFIGSPESKEIAEQALQSYQSGDFEKSGELYSELLKHQLPASKRTSYAYGLGTASRNAEKYDDAVDAFSDVLTEDDPDARLRAHQGLAHSLYDQGEHAILKQAEMAMKKQHADKTVESQKFRKVAQFTMKAWQDSVKHFDAALEITPDDEKIRENRDFVQKRLDELQKLSDQQQQQQQQGGEGDEKQEGEESGDQQKGQKGDQSQEGQSGKDPGDQDGDGQGEQNNDSGGDQDGEKEESIAKEGNEKQKGPLPEGEIEAAGEGEEEGDEEGMAGGDGTERDEETGFSANEARAFLRSYADDQKGVELRQQREPPANGKDW